MTGRAQQALQAVLAGLGITARREAERKWRTAAASAQPGEVWTMYYDSRGHVAWLTGPVTLLRVQGADQPLKLLGEELLPDQARPLRPGTGVAPARYRSYLRRGDVAPGPLPVASGQGLEVVPDGAAVVVEHRNPAVYPGIRMVDDGPVGRVMTLNGHRGRHVGDTWVALATVTGLDYDLAPGRDPRNGAGCSPATGPAVITADGGLTMDGQL